MTRDMRNAPLRKRRSDAVYASNAERQRAYRRRKAAQRSGQMLAALRAGGMSVPPEGARLTAQQYGILGNHVKRTLAAHPELWGTLEEDGEGETPSSVDRSAFDTPSSGDRQSRPFWGGPLDS
jgi:hypothetical protein